MRDYEMLCLMPPDIDEERTQAVFDRIRSTVEADGGSVDKVDVWGKRRLAYEINGHRDGVYALLLFKSDPAAIAELERVLGLVTDVIRYVIVRLDED